MHNSTEKNQLYACCNDFFLNEFFNYLKKTVKGMKFGHSAPLLFSNFRFNLLRNAPVKFTLPSLRGLTDAGCQSGNHTKYYATNNPHPRYFKCCPPQSTNRLPNVMPTIIPRRALVQLNGNVSFIKLQPPVYRVSNRLGQPYIVGTFSYG